MDSQVYEPGIGLEIHAQLLTKSKLFCGCSTQYGNPPNTLTCPVCLGHPGSLPVLNKKAVEMGIKLALSTHSNIHLRSTFARKNYFYPDLPKGYQITQYHSPLASEGYLEIEKSRSSKSIGIERINLEEDSGKSIHEGMRDSSHKTCLDFNRSGVPLLEIVGKPEISSPEEAVEFLQLFRLTLQYLKICDGNMEEGSLRCDANLSIRKKDTGQLGTKTELKNLNSFRFLQKALEYETSRQIKQIEKKNPVVQETRFWDEKQNRTVPMRSKEEAHDYRYFPEPDLPPLVINEEWVHQIEESLPETPQQKRHRFCKEYQLPLYDAKILTSSSRLADYYEQLAEATHNPKQASNWIMREVLQHLKENNIDIDQFRLSPQDLSELILLVEKNKVSIRAAKEKIFPEMIRSQKKASTIMEEKGLSQISDETQLRELIHKVIGKNPKPLQQYLNGKTQVVGFFVGQVMKETRGTANPQLVNQILKKVLDSYKNNS